MMRQELERREKLENQRLELEARREQLLRQVRERNENERLRAAMQQQST